MSKSGQNPDRSGQGHLKQTDEYLPESQKTIIHCKISSLEEFSGIRTNPDKHFSG